MRENFRRGLVGAAILAVAGAAHLHTVRYGFVFDERLLIEENPAVHSLTHLRAIFLDKFWPGPVAGIYYRPMITFSYALNYALAGSQPWIYHLTNVLLHGLSCFFLYRLLLHLGAADRPAALTALFFAVHPSLSESVAWIPGRTDVMAALFLSLAWLLLLRGREERGAFRRSVSLAAAVFSFLLALGAKETAVVLPGLVIVHDWLTGRFWGRRRWAEYLALAGAAGLYFVLRKTALAGGGLPPAPDPVAALSLLRRMGIMIMITAEAARGVLFPLKWRIDFAYEDELLGGSALRLFLSAAAVGALIFGFIFFRRRRPLTALGTAGFFLSLLPVLHLVPFPTVFAERFLYLPAVFLLLATVDSLSWLFDGEGSGAGERHRAFIYFGIATLAVVGTAFGAARSQVFRDDLSFWREGVKQAPGRAVPHNWLGIAYRNRGWWREAEGQYLWAVRVEPDFVPGRMNLAEVLMNTGRGEEARALLIELIAAEPENPDLHFNLGSMNAALGRREEARAAWEEALRLDPNHLRAHLAFLQYYLVSSEGCPAARSHFEAIKKIDPGNPRLQRAAWLLQERCPGAEIP